VEPVSRSLQRLFWLATDLTPSPPPPSPPPLFLFLLHHRHNRHYYYRPRRPHRHHDGVQRSCGASHSYSQPTCQSISEHGLARYQAEWSTTAYLSRFAFDRFLEVYVESSQVGPYCTDTQLPAECHDRDTRFGSSYETSRETRVTRVTSANYSGPWKRDLEKQKNEPCLSFANRETE